MLDKKITKVGHFMFSMFLLYMVFSFCLTLFYYNKIEKDPVSFYFKFNKEWSDIRENIAQKNFLSTPESWRNITSEIEDLQKPFKKGDKYRYKKSFMDMLNNNLKETTDLIKSKEIKKEKEVDFITISTFENLKIENKQADFELYIEKIKLLIEKQKEMKYIRSPLAIFTFIFFFMVLSGMLMCFVFCTQEGEIACNKISLSLFLVAPALSLSIIFY